MALPVVAGAQIMCSFGLAPSALMVPPSRATFVGNMPPATITDAVPFMNIMPFGLCTTPSNPATAALTAAALGVLTPAPCTPVTVAWTPGKPTTLIGNLPAVDQTCTCQCAFGGVITVLNPGSTTAIIG